MRSDHCCKRRMRNDHRLRGVDRKRVAHVVHDRAEVVLAHQRQRRRQREVAARVLLHVAQIDGQEVVAIRPLMLVEQPQGVTELVRHRVIALRTASAEVGADDEPAAGLPDAAEARARLRRGRASRVMSRKADCVVRGTKRTGATCSHNARRSRIRARSAAVNAAAI